MRSQFANSSGDSIDELDDFISLEHATTLLPGRPHRATLWRWISRGIKRGDDFVKLRSMRSGGRRYLRPSWIREFTAALNHLNESAHDPTGKTERQRTMQAAAAMNTLQRMGVRMDR